MENKLCSLDHFGTRKISNSPQRSTRQDAPNNHFLVTSPSGNC